MLGLFRKKTGLKAWLFDCKDSSITAANGNTIKAGGDTDCQLKLEGAPSLFEIHDAGEGEVRIRPVNAGGVLINSAPLSADVTAGGMCTFQYNDRLFYLLFTPEALEKAKNADMSRWLVFYAQTGRVEDEIPFDKIKFSIQKRAITGDGIAICPKGFDMGFFFNHVFNPQLSSAAPAQAESGSAHSAAPVFSQELSSMILPDTVAPVTCPLCWLKFDVGDAMNIATHESLRGDPVLGPNEMLRFLPTEFTPDGIALDPAGMPAPDIACPHCRKKLPSGFFDLENRIFSIVGAPSSGKSYYLSVLIREMQNSLYRNFGVTLKDLDPTGNILLTQMRNKLFSAEKPEDAILAKTALEGAMYERYPRFGKMVALPKPMTYALSSENKDVKETSIIFYDNAGEHFEPGLDLEESPGAMHVASSAAIFFLFDPASNRNFKKRLVNHPDPQLTIGGRLDQQDTILSEMEIRIKRILSINMSVKIKTPLAVIVGKYDIWKGLMPVRLESPVENGKLNLSKIDKNSDALREFLMEIDPAIVASAQSISSNVRFFALSALGHSPVKLESGPYAGKIAPVPSMLDPLFVEIPTLWALSQVTDIIPTSK